MLRALGVQIVVALVVCHSPAARAAETDSAARCAGIESDAQRLACYDRIFAPSARTGQGASAATPAVAAAPSGQLDEVERRGFGLSEAAKRQTENLPPAPEVLSVTIQSIERRPNGAQVFRTSEGQVWVEVEPSPRLRVNPGETVAIRKGTLGSYMLVTSKRVGTKVRRVN